MRLAHVEARLEQQFTLTAQILNAYDELIENNSDSLTFPRIQTYISVLQEDWEKFSVIHDAIIISINQLSPEDRLTVQQHTYLKTDAFTITRKSFLNTLEWMKTLQNSAHNKSIESTSSHSSLQPTAFQIERCQPRLPRIDLPKFNGTLSDWSPFKDLFQSLVLDNSTLTAIERFQYLKTSLIGSAARLLKHTAITTGNFQKAWDSLVVFYENRRLLINSSLQSLFSLKRLTRESASDVEQLYTNLTQIYRSLESLDCLVHTWDYILVYVAVQLLDPESLKEWERQLGSTKDPPTWQQYIEFLISRHLTLQSYENSSGKRGSTPLQPTKVKTHFQGKST